MISFDKFEKGQLVQIKKAFLGADLTNEQLDSFGEDEPLFAIVLEEHEFNSTKLDLNMGNFAYWIWLQTPYISNSQNRLLYFHDQLVSVGKEG